jgi:hypothetical protein
VFYFQPHKRWYLICQADGEQWEAAERGKPVEIEESGKEYVLISRDVYDRLKNLHYDDSEWTEEEMMLLAAEAAEDLDNMDEIKP